MIGYQPSSYSQVCHFAALGSDIDHASSLANTADRLKATASRRNRSCLTSLHLLETRIKHYCQKQGPYTIDTSAIRLFSSCYISTLSALPSSAYLNLLPHCRHRWNTAASTSQEHTTPHTTTLNTTADLPLPSKLSGRYSGDPLRAITAH